MPPSAGLVPVHGFLRTGARFLPDGTREQERGSLARRVSPRRPAPAMPPAQLPVQHQWPYPERIGAERRRGAEDARCGGIDPWFDEPEQGRLRRTPPRLPHRQHPAPPKQSNRGEEGNEQRYHQDRV